MLKVEPVRALIARRLILARGPIRGVTPEGSFRRAGEELAVFEVVVERAESYLENRFDDVVNFEVVRWSVHRLLALVAQHRADVHKTELAGGDESEQKRATIEVGLSACQKGRRAERRALTWQREDERARHSHSRGAPRPPGRFG